MYVRNTPQGVVVNHHKSVANTTTILLLSKHSPLCSVYRLAMSTIAATKMLSENAQERTCTDAQL